ncbi:MAG TPA: heavy metal sensor histidine kinase [Chthonomonadaceae bacterium]|nr:heavy metal sensor histidine kinase [Chthonomonadaceae bacterium]
MRLRVGRPRSLRAQLALWHGGLLALTLLLLSAFTYVLLRQFLNSRADAALETYAETTAKNIAAILYHQETLHPGTPLDEKQFVSNDDLQSWGRYVQVINPYGQKVAYSDALRTLSLPVSNETMIRGFQQHKPATFETEYNLGEYPVRIVTVPVQMGNKVPYLVQVGASVEGVEAALQRAAVILLVLTPSIFLIALLGGWWLVGRALKPVDDMTQAALSIESKHLDLRLVPPRTDNEIGRLAAALNEMIARLDKSFRQIERFSADASHELKTPLTSIRGEAEVALMSDLSPEEYRKTLRSIVEETERLSSIVNNLLLLSRADADQVRLKQEPLSLDEVALAAYEPMERLARRKNITLDIEAMDSVRLRGDSLWLGQLITNLLHNAINYTPEGGSVVLSLTHVPDPNALDGPGCAVLSVRDTGPGIPAEHLPHIFDRFYRVDSGRSRDQGGSGLGLNIARWIAESHGGQISVASEVGKGTTFTVRLPATPSE